MAGPGGGDVTSVVDSQCSGVQRLTDGLGPALLVRTGVVPSVFGAPMQLIDDRPVTDGLLVPLHGDEDGLRLVAAGEHEVDIEQPRLRNDLGHVRARFGDSQLPNLRLTHATRIHTSPVVMSVGLYNSDRKSTRLN